MNPIAFALRHPITVIVLLMGLVVGSGLALFRMKIDIFPNLDLPVLYVVQPYGGMDPAQMEGLAHLPLREPFPLHQRHPSRRIAEHPGLRADEALLPSGHRHGAGDGRDRRAGQPLAGLHAAGNGAAVRRPLRHRQRAGRLPRPRQRNQEYRRHPGGGLHSRAPHAGQSARRVGAAAVRRQPAHHCRPRRSRQTAVPASLAQRRGRGPDHRQHRQPVRQRAHSGTRCRLCRSTRWWPIRRNWATFPFKPGSNVYLRDIGVRSRTAPTSAPASRSSTAGEPFTCWSASGPMPRRWPS